MPLMEREYQKRDIQKDVSFLLVRHFCCAKVVACGRVIEREGGTRQRFPPHTLPSLRYAGRNNKTCGIDRIKDRQRRSFIFGFRDGPPLHPRRIGHTRRERLPPAPRFCLRQNTCNAPLGAMGHAFARVCEDRTGADPFC